MCPGQLGHRLLVPITISMANTYSILNVNLQPAINHLAMIIDRFVEATDKLADNGIANS